jgi:hypothetical protein
MSEICVELHQLFSELNRFQFPFDANDIPLNGIYILFEKSEHAHGVDRIVRIGTHTGNDQLRSRLKQHFINEIKDRSIFRKNIGRALLNKNHDPFLEQWEWDLTTRKAREKFSPLVDFNKQKRVEAQVTDHLQTNLSFVVLRLDSKDERLMFESRIISTVSLCDECKPSNSWLGMSSPKHKIRESGLWLVNELYKEPLTSNELTEIKSLCDS